MKIHQKLIEYWKIINGSLNFDNSKSSLVLLIAWVSILLISNNGQQSFMAHDEGYYFLQGRWIAESGDWLTVRWWQQPEYDRTIGLQWVIALFYQTSSILANFIPNFNEQITRSPNLISSIFASILTYKIASYWLQKGTAWLAGALLILSHLWLQYSRMGTQDIPLVAIELLLIFSLLKATNISPKNYHIDQEKQDIATTPNFQNNNYQNYQTNRSQNLWLLIAGICVGIGFLIKSVMIFLPCLALIPFLIYHRKHHHIYRNWWLYLGLIIGFLPFMIWFALSTAKYGALPFEQLFGKLLILGKKAYHSDANIFYYFWNIPVNSLPWSLLALWQLIKYLCRGFGSCLKTILDEKASNKKLSHQSINLVKQLLNWCNNSVNNYHLLVWFYPIILGMELTIFSTRTAYYALQIYPWLAIWAALGIEDITTQINLGQKTIAGKIFTYFLGFIGFVAIILSILIKTNIIKTEGLLLLIVPALIILGIGWLGLIYWWHQAIQKNQSHHWQAALLLSTWLGLATVGFTGVLGNYSPELKLALQQPQIATILQQNQIYFVAPKEVDGEEHKTWVLLGCYTPKLGQYLPELNLLPTQNYAWIHPNLVATAEANGFNNLATVKGWSLMQKRAIRHSNS
jgi:4-amino-4-deoxy-L-arabinose transferase-like glycosyltransferase